MELKGLEAAAMAAYMTWRREHECEADWPIDEIAVFLGACQKQQEEVIQMLRQRLLKGKWVHGYYYEDKEGNRRAQLFETEPSKVEQALQDNDLCLFEVEPLTYTEFIALSGKP